MPQVTLYCDTKEISVESSDPSYHEFFDSLREATGSLPDRLEVPSYILEQYDSLLALFDWMQHGPLIFRSFMRQYPYEDGKIVAGPPLPSRKEATSSLPPLVILADVSRIMQYLVSCHPSWILYTCLGGASSPGERMDYYRTAGLLLSEMNVEEYLPSGGAEAYYSVLNNYQGPNRLSVDGFRHNLVVQAFKIPSTVVSPHWDDLALLTDDASCYAYAGLPCPSVPQLAPRDERTNPFLVVLRKSRTDIYYLSPQGSYDIRTLYDNALKSLTTAEGHSILHPVLFGLSVLEGTYTDIDKYYSDRRTITLKKGATASLDVFGLLALIHLEVLSYHNRKKTRLLYPTTRIEDLPHIIEDIVSHLGTGALHVINATLQHYWASSERTEVFASLVKKRVPKKSESTSFVALPYQR